MDIGTYAATSAGILQMKKLEVQNNNLANTNTVGFKRQYLVQEEQPFEKTYAGALNNQSQYGKLDAKRAPGVIAYESVVDFSQGAIRYTGNPLDVALRNPTDFFVINTPQGTEYTRAGNFTISQNNELITQDGMRVMGDGGALQIGLPGISINQDGSIQAQVGAGLPVVVGRLQVARFTDLKGLKPTEGARFRNTGAAPTTVDGIIEPKSVEMSNASPITGMIDLIATNRAFDAYSRAAQSIDGMNQVAITQVGKRTT